MRPHCRSDLPDAPYAGLYGRRNSETMSQTMTRRLSVFAIASLLAGAAALGVASPALAHDELVSTDLVTNESDGTSESVKLSFSNTIIEIGTEIVISASDGSSVTDGTPVVAGPDVTQALKKDLATGTYSASWRVVSSDGHPIEGAFGIQVKDDGSARIVDAVPTESEPPVAAQGEAQEPKTEQNPLPTWAIVAIGVGGTAVLAAVIVSLVVGLRRRSQTFGSDPEPNEH